jgi:folate-binding protein YgfZ
MDTRNASAPEQTGTQMNSAPGALRITGKDAPGFLQGQLTQDLNRLTPANPLLTGWANAKGRLLCVATLLSWGEATWLVVPQILSDPILSRLRMFVLRADVTIDAPPVTLHMVENKSEIVDTNYCIERDNCIEFRAASGPRLRLSRDRTEAAAANTGQAWRSANILAGIPTVWPATSETFVPQMLNLDLLDAIGFDKGCYVGQEVVARTQNLGRIKRRMYGFTAPEGSGAVPGGKVYHAGRECGRIVDAADTGEQTEILAVIRIVESALELALDPAGTLRLRQRELPYPVPRKLDESPRKA